MIGSFIALIRRPTSRLGLGILLALAGPISSHAAEVPPKNAKAQGGVDVELPAILAPLVVHGRLENYAYLVIALAPASPDKVFVIREKVPFLQDAFLRELNKTTIAKGEDPKAIDTEGAKARLVQRMNQILPPGTVTSLTFEQVTLTPIQSQP